MIKNNSQKALYFGVLSFLLASCGPIFETDTAQSIDLSQPVKVALLAPTGGGGELESLGRSLENAADLALFDHNADNAISLKKYPTAGDPARAASQAQLAQSEGANLIIGPLKSVEASTVDAATSLPILTFSNNAESVTKDTYVLGTTYDLLSYRLLDFTKRLGKKRVAIIAPEGLAGTQAADALKNAAKDTGTFIAYEVHYPLSPAQIDSYGASIARDLITQEIDAVVFTDTPTGGLSYVIKALANNGFTTANAAYLGLTRWDSTPDMITKVPTNGSYFVVPDPSAARGFEGVYASSYGTTPPPLAGLAYDGVKIATALVKNAKSTGSSKPFSESAISDLETFGATGRVGFGSNHQIQRGLAIMQILNGGVEIIESAPF